MYVCIDTSITYVSLVIISKLTIVNHKASNAQPQNDTHRPTLKFTIASLAAIK